MNKEDVDRESWYRGFLHHHNDDQLIKRFEQLSKPVPLIHYQEDVHGLALKLATEEMEKRNLL